MKPKFYFFIIFIFLFPSFAAGQNPVGWPDIVHFEKNTYRGGTQNWDIQQDKNGILYFANNEGMLTFDGTFWQTYALPNKTIVRSLAITADRRIYAGGQGDFGYFSPAANGLLEFHSLRDKIPAEARSFADVWDINAVGKDIFFRTQKHIFRYHEGKITVFTSGSEWLFMGSSDRHLYAQDKEKGLLIFRQNKWLPFLDRSLPAGFMTTALSPWGPDSLLLSSWEHGLYTLHKGELQPMKGYASERYTNSQVMGAIKLGENMLLVGTNIGGCFVVNRDGSILYNFSRDQGLQNNAVLSMLKDHNGNLWLGLNNGIDFIANNDAVRHVNPPIFDDGVGHYSIVHEGSLYVGLSGAVYRMELGDSKNISVMADRFRFINNSGGQAWGMNRVNGHLLLGKHEGAFKLTDAEAIPLAGNKGYWNFLPFESGGRTLVLAGNYSGIEVFGVENNSLRSLGSIAGFQESARFISIENDRVIWVSHPYKGVYRIDLTVLEKPVIKQYTADQGLPSTNNNHVYRVKNRVVVSTEKGIYEFNKQKNRFEPSDYFRKYFEGRYIRYLKEDQQGNVWFVQEKNLGVLDFSKKEPQIIYFPELNGKLVSGFEHINPIDANNILVGAQKGFYHINYEKYLTGVAHKTPRISLVKSLGKSDSTLFGGYFGEINEQATQKNIPSIGFSSNSFHFQYASVMHKNQANLEYSYYLEGFDKSWSAFSSKTEKDYTNLPAGDYAFKVKARNNFGEESEASSYRFTILPPWYQTSLAYFVYVSLFISLLWLLYRKQRRKFQLQQAEFQKEQDRLRYLHQLEIDKSEKEIVKLKNEKLKAEIDAKNSELASTLLHLVQKNELLSKIKQDLNRLESANDSDEKLHDMKKIIRQLTSEEKSDEGWEQFSVYFDKVHANFLEELKDEYPHMTTNDLKLSAYLKLGLSTKEIAEFMKISPRGVEIGRYRLRKKLQVPTEVSLFDFFQEFKAGRIRN